MREQLAEAKRQETHKRHLLLFGVLFAGAVCVLLIYAIGAFVFAPTITPTAPKKDSPSQVAEVTMVDPFGDQRARFVDGLNEYETRIETALERIDLRRWDAQRYHRIADLKKQATTQFGTGRYAEAVATLDDLTTQAQTVIEEARNLFDEAMERAAMAYQNDQYEEAKYQIERALMFDTEAVDAKQLQAKIERLAELLPLLEQIKIANKENNDRKEYALIEQALALDPGRAALAARKKALFRIGQDQTFATAVAGALDAVEKKQMTTAKKKLAVARRIYPNRPDVATLERQIMALEKMIRLDQAREAARVAMEQDDWIAAQNALEAARKEAPDDQDIADSLRVARRIVQFTELFAQSITRSDRLSNDKVHGKITQAVAQSETVSALSPSLQTQRTTVMQLLEQTHAEIPVDILSDGKTYVSVRGVGKIGATRKKTIRLRPGTYTFEGKRKGFESKLVTKTIPLGTPDFRITVICDEPI